MSNEILIATLTALGGGGIVGAYFNYLLSRKKEETVSYQSLLSDINKELERKNVEVQVLELELKKLKMAFEAKTKELTMVNSKYTDELNELEEYFSKRMAELRSLITD